MTRVVAAEDLVGGGEGGRKKGGNEIIAKSTKFIR